MVYQFTGKASLFNGRFWRTVDVRVKASSLQAAIAQGARQALKTKKKGTRIEGLSITLERLGPVMPVEDATVALSDECS
jgi:hypothetical protein